TSAILAVHTYGVPCDVRALEDIAKRHQLALIFDAAHAFDVRIDSTPIHRFGNATIYSTHASKLFHTGEGGVLVCSDEATQRRCDRMANFGFDGSGDAVECGTNAKMSELHAATGLAVLPKVNAERAARAALRFEYTSALNGIDGISLMAPPIHVKDSLQYLAIRVKSEAAETDNRIRNTVYERLISLGLESRKYFSPLCADFSYVSQENCRTTDELTVARRAVHQVLCLPFHSGVNRDTVLLIADTFREVIRRDS
ncbi:MAG: DegT/DnrJ/EryC1/StrS family aminotransferase, partial [Burkholderiales bacterium]